MVANKSNNYDNSNAVMSLSLIEEMEKMVKETCYVKQRLNLICENVWDLLNPHGTEKNELFRPKENDLAPKIDPICETSNVSSTLVESLESVDKLIALGKQIRETTKTEKNKGIKSFSNVQHNNTDPKAQRFETLSKIYGNKIRISSIESRKKARDDKSKKNDLVEETDFYNDNNRCLSKQEKDKYVPELSLKVECKYSHLCSPTLLSIIGKLQMPEELQYLLKQFYHYEKTKLTVNVIEECPKKRFHGRYINFVKLKLNNDLKTNIKHTERYLKYLDISEEASQKSHVNSGESCHTLKYSSVDELSKYEEKHHHLMELTLRLRLIDSISNQLSNLTF